MSLAFLVSIEIDEIIDCSVMTFGSGMYDPHKTNCNTISVATNLSVVLFVSCKSIGVSITVVNMISAQHKCSSSCGTYILYATVHMYHMSFECDSSIHLTSHL